MSDINGEGHGSDHNWKHSHTSEGRQTLYKCVDCHHVFWHDYPHVPNIFEAMEKTGVPLKCHKKPIAKLSQKTFDRAKGNLFAAAKFMQEHEAKIVEQLALDTAAARELDQLCDDLHSLLESMVEFKP